jgi:transaldolase / glucose-6-phosphate isomerase
MSDPTLAQDPPWILGPNAARVAARLAAWQTDRVPDRLWRGDPTLWPAAPKGEVSERIGWLELPTKMQTRLPAILTFAEGVRADGYQSVVVLGMGGSSLAPSVLAATFGRTRGYPELLVLDSTHPGAIESLTRHLDASRSLFLVSSKSGTTVEPLDFQRYFWEIVRATGVSPGPHFAAITDPGTPLEKFAEEQGFREVFRAIPTEGGRYSALTEFGLVPAAVAGIDVPGLLQRAEAMARTCGPAVAAPEDPALRLGATLGELAVTGRDKLTILAAPTLAAFPTWAEQLVAESTGKIGRGIVPVVDEPRAAPEGYGSDRLFVEIQSAESTDPELRAFTDRLAAAGHPIVRLQTPTPLSLGAEFFRWELAVASSAMILGIDPYDQPDVEFAKELARKEMARPAATGGGAAPAGVSADDLLRLSLAVEAWVTGAHPKDYLAIQAYLPPDAATTAALVEIRRALLERTRAATTLGYGPRFLHSTGQLHKGGPNTGLFLQIVDSPNPDLEVPGVGYTFGRLIQAQALGDYHALQQKGRRVLRVDLERDRAGGLQRLGEAVRG